MTGVLFCFVLNKAPFVFMDEEDRVSPSLTERLRSLYKHCKQEFYEISSLHEKMDSHPYTPVREQLQIGFTTIPKMMNFCQKSSYNLETLLRYFPDTPESILYK